MILLKRSELLPLGFTDALIRQLLGEPDEKEDFKRGIYKGTRHWFAQERVQAAMERPEFLECQKRRKSRAEAPLARMEGFGRRYVTWRAAIADACHALHSANRYCKWRSCSTANRTEIYSLKNAFVQLLYERGYCSACWEHILVLPPKECRACYGTGDQGDCDRCGGSGQYLPEKRLKFYVFRFAIGRAFCWHQPESLVTFPVVTTQAPAEWSGVEREKPLGMAKSQLAAAKDLVRWVIEQAKVPEPEAKFLETPISPMDKAEQQSLFA